MVKVWTGLCSFLNILGKTVFYGLFQLLEATHCLLLKPLCCLQSRHKTFWHHITLILTLQSPLSTFKELCHHTGLTYTTQNEVMKVNSPLPCNITPSLIWGIKTYGHITLPTTALFIKPEVSSNFICIFSDSNGFVPFTFYLKPHNIFY